MSETNSEQLIPKRRGKPQRWVPTPEIDAAIRRLYVERAGRTKRPAVAIFAEKIRWPAWAVKKRARTLGLVRTKEAPWSEAEIELLHRWAWLSDERIRLRLKAAGFTRTTTAIHMKLKRTHAKQSGDYYTATGLADCFGCDSHCVTAWIKKKWLKAQLRGTARTPQQGGDTWMILHSDVRQFVIEHPTVFDLRKADQLWFIDLLVNR